MGKYKLKWVFAIRCGGCKKPILQSLYNPQMLNRRIKMYNVSTLRDVLYAHHVSCWANKALKLELVSYRNLHQSSKYPKTLYAPAPSGLKKLKGFKKVFDSYYPGNNTKWSYVPIQVWASAKAWLKHNEQKHF